MVHLIGATGGLAALLLLGPRRGKYGSNGRPRAIPGHSTPLVRLGVLILWLGWFGFNPGSTLAALGKPLRRGGARHEPGRGRRRDRGVLGGISRRASRAFAGLRRGLGRRAEGRFVGTHSGVLRTPTGEVPATGRLVDFRWMSAYEARGDKLASEHLFSDQVELLTQLGLSDPASGPR